MNPDIQHLKPYPFERLLSLKKSVANISSKSPIALSIGEPRHPSAHFVVDALTTHLGSLSKYTATKGLTELRQAISNWLINRFHLPPESVNPESQVIPVSGTREGLFSFAQAVIDRSSKPLVLLPNPFYQIYEGACLLAGAQPYYLNTTSASNFLPDFDSVPKEVWEDCQLIYICSPGNPTGAVISEAELQKLIRLAEQYDFIIASDECYSEIYFSEDKPPCGLLQAAVNMGNTEFRRCVVFHSLSKRSNAPGLRSGFVAGDAQILAQYLQYRTYHGCAMPEFIQQCSIQLWQDETHVRHNRDLYREKFNQVLAIIQPALDVQHPEAGFYLWPKTPNTDEEFTQGLYAQQNVIVLPGTYLSRSFNNINPGNNYVRIALVAELPECLEAANRIFEYLKTL